jgi:hypothetical protein
LVYEFFFNIYFISFDPYQSDCLRLIKELEQRGTQVQEYEFYGVEAAEYLPLAGPLDLFGVRGAVVVGDELYFYDAVNPWLFIVPH